MLKTATVLLSGGQDSATCLLLALRHATTVNAIAVQYGQRHNVELECASALCRKHGVDLTIVDATSLLALGTSALTDPEMEVGKPHPDNAELPSSFVPGRNAILLTLAHIHAMRTGAEVIYTGTCETDYSGYPDCREEFVKALSSALNMGYKASIQIRYPLMHLDKAATFQLATLLGGLGDIINLTHTCYEGRRDLRHAWGRGCGQCPACLLRKAGWERYMAGNIVEAQRHLAKHWVAFEDEEKD